MEGRPILAEEATAYSNIFYEGDAYEEKKVKEVFTEGEVKEIIFEGERGREWMAQKSLRNGEVLFFAPDGSLKRKQDARGCTFLFSGERQRECLVTSLDAEGYVMFASKRPRTEY